MQFYFNVNEMSCKADHEVIGAKHAKKVHLAVDKKEMFIFDEEIL